MASYDIIGKTLTVSEANGLIRDTIAEFFSELTIQGEVSGMRPSSTGHWYFTLKDSDATIDSAVFRSAQYSMSMPKNGDLVIAKGSVSYYAKNGRLTFVIRAMKIMGEGALAEIIEKRKDYYRSLGYFDEDKKKAIAEDISRIAVVTSPTGAAIRDILNITKRRAPGINIIILPAAAQGESAKYEIASRIRQANNFMVADVIIVGRGGGSQEDLMAFSEPEVIEAIHESTIPVISAVGHEIDWALSDYVADKRAPTPSAAAEIVTESAFRRKTRLNNALSLINAEMRRRIARAESRLQKAEGYKVLLDRRIASFKKRIPSMDELGRMLKMRAAMCENQIGWNEEEIERLMRKRFDEKREETRALIQEAERALRNRLENGKLALSAVIRETEALSPLSILSRGYSLTTDENGAVIKCKEDVKPGEKIRTRLFSGSIVSTVEDNDEL